MTEEFMCIDPKHLTLLSTTGGMLVSEFVSHINVSPFKLRYVPIPVV